MKAIPIWDYVIVKEHKEKATEKVVNGLILPGMVEKKPTYEIISISKTTLSDGDAWVIPFKVGDFVHYQKTYNQTEIIDTENNERFIILRADDIIAYEPQTGSGES